MRPGLTYTIERVRPGVVRKRPILFMVRGIPRVDLAFVIEPFILQRLGDHPQIVGFHGRDRGGGNPGPLLLQEASHGNLENYLAANPIVPADVTMKWCRQLAEGLAYIHLRGVLHRDFHLGTVLVNETEPGKLDLLIADFGGSACNDLKLDGKGLPTVPFWHPIFGRTESEALDMFGLGSIMYTICVGMWPFCDTPRPLFGEKLAYLARVEELFAEEIYPETDNFPIGYVIEGCWKREYEEGVDVLLDLEAIE